MGLPQPGEIFDNYKVLKILGEGGMGQVFLAEDIKLSRKVALKFLGNGSGQKLDPKVLIRFENEAKILASLSHPNIVNIYTFGTYAGIHYLAMEYVEGVTLSRVIEKKSFGVMDSINAIKQVITGLQQAHEKGILHRDIKPANLLVGPNNQVKIVDFGISKSLLEDDQNLTKENHFIGTLNYMAPEILKGHPPTPASDLFSAGVVFYELLTGRNPFVMSTKIETIDKIRNEQLNLPEEVCRLIPPELQNVIAKLIAKEKSERYQSSLEVLADFEQVNDQSLPDFHGVSLRPEVVVTNREESRLFLVQRGYTEQEVDIIIKLAAKLVELKNANQDIETDATVDLLSGSPDSVHIDRESLNLAIENFETSQSNTRAISEPQPQTATVQLDSSKLKTNIPFPLFNPKFVIKGTLIIGFICFNLFALTKILNKLGVKFDPVNTIAGLILDSDSTEEPTNSLEDLKKKLQETASRQLSSVPAGEKKPLPEGTVLEYKVTRFNAITGEYLINQVNIVKVKQLRGNTMHAYHKSGKTGLWSTQHISSNAFLPPLRWYSKNRFNIAVTPQGNYDEIYPLHIGKKASFKYKTLQAGGAFLESQRSCEVLSTVKAEAAGTPQDLFKIACTTQTDDIKETSTITYSPQWNLIVEKNIVEQSAKGKFEESMLLQSIKFPQKINN